MSKRPISSTEYEAAFPTAAAPPAGEIADAARASLSDAKNIRKEALERAEEVRRFEIELYWKRGGYFWTIIAAILAAYGLVWKFQPAGAEATPSTADKLPILLVISCLGLVISVAWHMVNRGSAAWQRNWETHVDLLEDEVTGPLYKTVVDGDRTYTVWDPLGPLNVSPSRLTLIASLYVILIWVALVFWSLPADLFPSALRFGPPENVLLVYILAITLVALFALVFRSKTRSDDDLIAMSVRERKWK